MLATARRAACSVALALIVVVVSHTASGTAAPTAPSSSLGAVASVAPKLAEDAAAKLRQRQELLDRLGVGTLTSLSDRDAVEVTKAMVPELFSKPAVTPIKHGLRQTMLYQGDQAATIVDPDPRRNIAVRSTLPLRAVDESGAKTPVDLSLQPKAAGFGAANPLVDVTFPETLAQPTSVEDLWRVRISGARADGQLAGATVAYPNALKDTTVLWSPTPNGAMMTAELLTSSSPTTIPLEIGLPAGATLRQSPGAADVQAVDAAGKTIGGIEAPRAWDANGTAIPVAYTVDAEAARIDVRVSTDAQTAFPVTVDPNFIAQENWGSNGVLNTNLWATNGVAGHTFTSPGGSCLQVGVNFVIDGLCVFSKRDVNFGAYPTQGQTGEWSYSAPNSNSFVNEFDIAASWSAGLSGTGFATVQSGIAQGATPYNFWGANTGSHPNSGLWSSQVPSTQTFVSHCQTSNCDPAPNTTANKGGTRALFSVSSYGTFRSTVNPPDTVGLMTARGLSVYLGDYAGPSSPVVTGQPTGWYKDGSTITVTAQAQDVGMGLYGLTAFIHRTDGNYDVITYGGDGSLQTAVVGSTSGYTPTPAAPFCEAPGKQRCPTGVFSKSFSFLANGHTEGSHGASDPGGLQATDALQKTNSSPFSFNIDRVPPTIGTASTGTLVTNSNRYVKDASYDIVVNAVEPADRSGVMSVALVRAENSTTLDTASFCVITAAVCQQSETTSSTPGAPTYLAVDSSLLPSNVDSNVDVRLTDLATNVATRQTIKIRPDRTAPAAPTVTPAAPTNWFGPGSEFTSTLASTDAGSGLKTFKVSVPNAAGGTADFTTIKDCQPIIGASCATSDNAQVVWSIDDKTAEGPQQIQSRVIDAVDNAPSTATNQTLNIDKTPPTLTLSGSLYNARDAASTSGDLTLNVAATDTVAGQFRSGVGRINVAVDGQADNGLFDQFSQTRTTACVTSASQPCDLSGAFLLHAGQLSAGQHTISVTATDQTDPRNTSAEQTFTINVDSGSPLLTLAHDPAIFPWADDATRTVTATSEDVVSGIAGLTFGRPAPATPATETFDFSCATSQNPCPITNSHAFSYTTTVFAEGPTGNLEVRARDKAGNVTDAQTWSLKIDRTPPAATITGSILNLDTVPVATGGEFNVHVDATDAFSGVRYVRAILDGNEIKRDNGTCTIDGGCGQNLAFDYVLKTQKLSNAAHTLVIETSDQVGAPADRHTTSRTFNFTVLNVLPEAATISKGLGYERWQTYDDHDTGADSRASVNEATGNLAWTHQLVANPGRGIDTNVRLTYNSMEPGVGTNGGDLLTSPYNQAGTGVSVDIGAITRLNQPLSFSVGTNFVTVDSTHSNLATLPDGSPATVTWTDGDGTAHTFTKSGTNTWTAEPGVFLRFRQYSTLNAKFWALTKTDGTIIWFNRDGYPTYIADRNLNYLSIIYQATTGTTQCGRSLTNAGLLNLLPVLPACPSRVAAIADAAYNLNAAPNRVVYFSYKTANGLTVVNQISDHGARVTTLNYDTSARLTGITEGQATAGYGFADVTRTWGLGYTDTSGYLTSITDPRSHPTTIGYEASSNVLRRVQTVTDRSSRITRYGYMLRTVDGADYNVIAITDPKGRVWQDRTNQTAAPSQALIESIDPRGVTDRYEWDTATNRTTKRTQAYNTPDAAESNWVWGSLGQRLSETLPHAPGATTGLRVRKYAYTVHGGRTEYLGIGESASTPTVFDLTTVVEPKGNPHTAASVTDPPASNADYKTTYGVDLQTGNVTNIQRPDTGLETIEYGTWSTQPNTFPSYGLVKRVTLPHGETIEYPDEDHDALQLPDSSPEGLPLVRKDEKGGLWRYRYDTAGNLITARDPRGVAQASTTDDLRTGNLKFTSRYDYDALDRRTQEIVPKFTDTPTPAFITRVAGYDQNGNRITWQDGTSTSGHPVIWKTSYTSTDQVDLQTSPAVEHYSGTGTTGLSTAAAEITKFDYDQTDQIAAIHAPEGRTGGTDTSPTFGNGYLTRFAYNDVDDVVVRREVADAAAPQSTVQQLVTSYAYDRRGNVIGVADPRHNRDATDADAAVNATKPATQRTAMTYDLADRRTDVIDDPDGLKLHSQTTYDDNDNVATQIAPRQFDTDTTNDPRAGQNFTTTFEYDKADRLTAKTDPRDRRTQYDLRNDGLVSDITSPRGTDTTGSGFTDDYKTHFTYDAAGDLASVEMPRAPDEYRDPNAPDTDPNIPGTANDPLKITFTRNAVGDPETVVDARGNTITNTFMDSGELRTTSRPSWWSGDQSQPSTTLPSTPGAGDFGETAAQTLPAAMPRAGATTIYYDNELRPTSIQDAAGKTRTMTYDDTGRLTQELVPYKDAVDLTPAQTGPNRDDACTPNTDPGYITGQAIITTRAYDRDGNLRRVRDGRCQDTILSYDQFDRLISTDAPAEFKVGSAAAVRAITSTVLDRNGNTRRVDLPRGGGAFETYAYDEADRLVQMTEPYGGTQAAPKNTWSYSYDANGNRTRTVSPRGNVPNANVASFTTKSEYDRADQLEKTTDGLGAITTYDYDRDGNQTLVDAPGAASDAGSGNDNRVVVKRKFDARGLPWITQTGDASGDRTTTITEYDAAANLRRTVTSLGLTNTANATFGDERPIRADAATPTVDDDVATHAGYANWHATVNAYNADNLLTAAYQPWGSGDGDPSLTTATRYKQRVVYNERGWPTAISGIYKWTGSNDPVSTNTADYDRLARYEYFNTGWVKKSHDKQPAAGQDPVISFDYDLTGNQTEWASPGRSRKVNREFRADGQLTKRVAKRLDINGNPLNETRTYSYTYNPAGELASIIDENPPRNSNNPSDPQPTKRTTTITRDRSGRATRINEGWDSGRDTKLTYQPGGLISSAWVDGRFDSDGHYAGGRVMRYAYTALDDVDTVTVDDGSDQPKVTDLDYWPSRALKKTTRANGTVENRYYATDGQILKRTVAPVSGASKTTTYSYDDERNRTTDERGLYQYNARQQLTRWEHTGNLTQANPNRAIDYLPAGNGSLLSSHETRTFTVGAQTQTSTIDVNNTYDAERLDTSTVTTTNVLGSSTTTENRTRKSSYDIFGAQRTIRTKVGSASYKLTTHYAYDPYERLLSARDDKNNNGDVADNGCPSNATPCTSKTAGYDADKDERASEVYCYDAFDRRDRKVTNVAGIAAPPDADGDGKSDDDGSTDSFAIQRTACASPDSSTSTLDYSYLGLTEALTREKTTDEGVKYYDYTPDLQRLGQRARIGSSTLKFRPYETDAQGSVVAVEHADGSATNDADRYVFDPYGDTLDDTGLSTEAKRNPFRFQGFYLDRQVHTYDMQARAYRPSQGMFLSQDRFGDPRGDIALQLGAATNSRYAFLAGNPVGNIEFDGHTACGVGEGACAKAAGEYSSKHPFTPTGGSVITRSPATSPAPQAKSSAVSKVAGAIGTACSVFIIAPGCSQIAGTKAAVGMGKSVKNVAVAGTVTVGCAFGSFPGGWSGSATCTSDRPSASVWDYINTVGAIATAGEAAGLMSAARSTVRATEESAGVVRGAIQRLRSRFGRRGDEAADSVQTGGTAAKASPTTESTQATAAARREVVEHAPPKQAATTRTEAKRAPEATARPTTYPLSEGGEPLRGARDTGVARAWAQERDLLNAGGGSRSWSADEAEELWMTGRVKNYTGHHTNNVESFPDWAGDPRNIRFLANGSDGGFNEHLYSDLGHYGNWANPTSGDLIDRAAMIKNLGK